MRSDYQDVWVLGDRADYRHTATSEELRQAGTLVGHHCHCYKSEAARGRRDRQESGRQRKKWRSHVEGDRSYPGLIIEGGAEVLKERERERGKREGRVGNKQVNSNIYEHRESSLT